MPRVCLITGGTQGLGQETAELLASQGWSIIISGRNVERGRNVVSNIQASGGNAKFIQADVSTQSAVKKLHEDAITAYGRLDAAVNSAGIALESAKLAECSTENFEKMLTVNVLGVFWCMQEQVRAMLPNKAGRIVNLASVAGLHGIPYTGTYCATKHAVVAMTRTAALEYATEGITITAVAPGAIRTTILDHAINSGKYSEESISAMHPVQRIGVPMDVARAISFLLDSPFVTGSILEVDGGIGAA